MIDSELIEELREKLKRTADWEYFFSKITSPDWAGPLFENGLFGEPPGLIWEGGEVRVPSWPPSAYLARVAGAGPDLVATIVARIPDTDNSRVHSDLMQALLPASVDTTLPLIPKVKGWLHGPVAGVILLDPTAKLVKSLAEKGAITEALDLFLAWLAPSGDPDGAVVGRGSVDDWAFGEAIDRVVPALASLNPDAIFRSLISLLASVQAHEIGVSPATNPQDWSTLWRPAIEDHEQNRLSLNKNTLLVHLRDTAKRAASGDCSQLATVVEALRRGVWRIFDRLALNLVREAGAGCSELVSQLLCDRTLFDDPYAFHEYMVLARDRFGDLPLDERNQVLEWISAGPDVTSYRELRAGRDGHPPSDVAVADYADHWRVRRFAVIKSWLPADRLLEYQELVRRVGDTEHPEFLSWTSELLTGPTSPISQQRILETQLDQLLTFLATWEPETGFMLPTPEGLGRELALAMVADPGRFLEHARDFEIARPNYVRAVFDAVRQLLGNRHRYEMSAVEWGAVLDLAEWVVREPRGDESTDDFDCDYSWINCRKAIAHMLDAAIGMNVVPVRASGPVWNVIEQLLDDPQPSQAFEETFGGSNMGPSQLAINTVRGTAMHAAFQYLMWVESADSDGLSSSASALGAIAGHLDPTRDPSPAVHSVFGWWFPTVAQRYPEWAITHLDPVFPLADERRAFFDAAWSVYLVRWRPGKLELDMLRGQYELGIALLGGADGNEHAGGALSTTDQLIGHHLAWLYLRGVIPLADDLLTSFFIRAPREIRASATEFLGRIFLQHPLPQGVEWLRLQAWWESRRQACAQSGDQLEMGKIGWWAGAADSDPSWYLAALEDCLRQNIDLDGESFAIQKLPQLAEHSPGAALTCVKLMEASGRYPQLLSWQDENVISVLRAALRSGQDDLVRTARGFIDLVSAKGEADYSSLLHHDAGEGQSEGG